MNKIFIVLSILGKHTGINIEKAVEEKMEIIEKRYK